MPVLLEYHGSYIMYALDLQARKNLRNLINCLTRFIIACRKRVLVMHWGASKQPIGEDSGLDYQKPELLFYDSTSDNFNNSIWQLCWRG